MSKATLLLLRLEGPLQSWGFRARWDVRDTGDEPTKSGVVGLLGCALGFAMYDPRLETELDRNLTMGVRVEKPGEPLVDYHTVTGVLPTAEGKVKGNPGDPQTIQSWRSYLQDAAFLVALAGPEELLRRCHDALLDPRWPVFLGRKSCPPTRPLVEALTVEYTSIEDALRRHPWSCQSMELWGLPPSGLLYYSVENPTEGARRPDAVRINPARMFGIRRVVTSSVPAKEVMPCT